MALVGMGVVLSLGVLAFVRLQSNAEQERVRANLVVTQQMELIKALSFTELRPISKDVVVWDHGTPGDPADDLHGTLEVVLRDSRGVLIVGPPLAAGLVQVEVTVTWNSRGREQHDTLMTYITP